MLHQCQKQIEIEQRNLAIYTVIAAIERGHVLSYGEVAKQAGYVNRARLLGRLLKQLPIDSTLPWHRVVRSDGKIGFAVSSFKYKQQINLLQQEGVKVNNGRLNMSLYEIK